jgi:hypothetical protein
MSRFIPSIYSSGWVNLYFFRFLEQTVPRIVLGNKSFPVLLKATGSPVASRAATIPGFSRGGCFIGGQTDRQPYFFDSPGINTRFAGSPLGSQSKPNGAGYESL